MEGKEIKKINMGITYQFNHCCGSAYPTSIYYEDEEIKEEQILAENNNPNNLIQKISMVTIIDNQNKNYSKYKSVLEMQN